MSLRDDIREAINRNSAENGSDTPDFILAYYLLACLEAFDTATKARDKWFGRDDPFPQVTLIERAIDSRGADPGNQWNDAVRGMEP